MDHSLDDVLKEISLDDGKIKAKFTLSGLDFWFDKGKGMMRIKRNAMLLIEAVESQPERVAAGDFDRNIQILTDRLTYVPEGDAAPVSLANDGYNDFLDNLESKDETKAMMVSLSMPQVLSVVCLGKSLMSNLLQETSISQQDSKEDLKQNSTESQKKATSKETSKEPALGLAVG